MTHFLYWWIETGLICPALAFVIAGVVFTVVYFQGDGSSE